MVTSAPPSSAAPRGVTVRAPGRLHLGFLDPSATLGRRFGSLGLVIDGFETVVQIRASERQQLSAANAAVQADAQAELARAGHHLDAMQRATGRTAPLHLHLARVLPAHAGFGSGTQLALAVGRAFCAWHGLALPTAEIARLLGRGRRSGIGIAGFEQGGLLLDAGPSEDGRPAPLLTRLALPPDWRVLLALDPGRTGLSGSDEQQAIATLPPFTRAQAAEVCHEVLMRVLAGAASADFDAFATGVSRVQHLVGRHFAPAQGNRLYASPAVERLCQSLAAQPGPAAVGQSSWGPTGFAILPSQAAAEAALEAARRAEAVPPSLHIAIVAARNHGAVLIDAPADHDAARTHPNS